MEQEKIAYKESSFWRNLFKSQIEDDSITTILLKSPVFSSLDSKDIKNLLTVFHMRSFKAQEYIFIEKDPGKGLFFIIDGEISIQKTSLDKNTEEITRLSKGDFFGEIALVNNTIRTASAVSVTDSHIAVIFKDDLDDFIENHPKKGIAILRGLLHIFVRRLQEMSTDIKTAN
jgi:CRP-like cAMP-binding protein